MQFYFQPWFGLRMTKVEIHQKNKSNIFFKPSTHFYSVRVCTFIAVKTDEPPVQRSLWMTPCRLSAGASQTLSWTSTWYEMFLLLRIYTTVKILQRANAACSNQI